MESTSRNLANDDGDRNQRSAIRRHLRRKRIENTKDLTARQRIARALELGRHAQRLRRDD